VSLSYRDLTTLEEYAQVVELERTIWGPGYVDVVPVPIFAITVMRGAVLVGAFDAGQMIGFVYSVAGIKHGKPTQWSHMLGVLPEFRNDGIGHRLKLLQRERTLAMGLDLIEWTYDPMQALNAHLNFTKLGVVVEEYEVNVYGTSNSPLHAGNPTDRFVAEWNIRDPHVEGRLARAAKAGSDGGGAAIPLRSHESRDAVAANAIASAGPPACIDVDLKLDARRIAVQIPMGFTEMLVDAPQLALAWRMATREIFTTYFARGYKAVDFILDRAKRRGVYLLVAKG
jgi:predicted GNAT superfamily acetyltransferase